MVIRGLRRVRSLAWMRRSPATRHAMASTGVCLNGRTMRLATRRTLEEGGVLHGQLHALRPDFLDRMVARGIRLPIGMYWGDGLMGSMAAHNLDAMGAPWDNRRIVGVAEAGYEIPQLSVRSPGDIRRQLRRKSRQMRGKLQNLALRDVIYRLGYEGLPANADGHGPQLPGSARRARSSVDQPAFHGPCSPRTRPSGCARPCQP